MKKPFLIAIFISLGLCVKAQSGFILTDSLKSVSFHLGTWIADNSENDYGNQSMIGIEATSRINRHKIAVYVDFIGLFTAPRGNFEKVGETELKTRNIYCQQLSVSYGREIVTMDKFSLDIDCGIGYGVMLNSSLLISPGISLGYGKSNQVRLRIQYYFNNYQSNQLNNINLKGNYLAFKIAYVLK